MNNHYYKKLNKRNDIYLENIKEKYYNNDKLTKLEKYMLMLKLKKREELLEVSKGDKNMSEVYKKLDDLSKDKYYALLYDEEEKKAYENKCILEDAIEDAKENGYSSGYDSGLNDGISNEKINIAKNLLSMNMTLEDISKATGLTIDEVKKLKENI